jgi:hypothetical protein
MFYSLACLSFFRYRSHGFRSLSMYFPIDYYRFRNYRNIDVVFVSDNIVSISFSRKRCENESDLAFYRSFPIVFIPSRNTTAASRKQRGLFPVCIWRDPNHTQQDQEPSVGNFHRRSINMTGERPVFPRPGSDPPSPPFKIVAKNNKMYIMNKSYKTANRIQDGTFWKRNLQ